MTSPAWLNETESRAWRGWLRAHDALMAELVRELGRESGLSGADYEVLVVLSESAERRLRMGALGAALLWEKSRLSHHVTRMERRGLVCREDCASDARGAFVAITQAGLRAIAQAAPGHVANVRRHFFDHLSPGDVDALARITETVLAPLAAVEPAGIGGSEEA